MPSNDDPSKIPEKGDLPEKSEKDILIDKLREQNILQTRALSKVHQKPIILEQRQTLNDFIRGDKTHTNLLRVASSSYNDEINRYNVSFQQGDHA